MLPVAPVIPRETMRFASSTNGTILGPSPRRLVNCHRTNRTAVDHGCCRPKGCCVKNLRVLRRLTRRFAGPRKTAARLSRTAGRKSTRAKRAGREKFDGRTSTACGKTSAVACFLHVCLTGRRLCSRTIMQGRKTCNAIFQLKTVHDGGWVTRYGTRWFVSRF